MKRTLRLFLAFTFATSTIFAQESTSNGRFESSTKGELLAIHFTFSDFDAAQNYKFFSFPKSSFNNMIPGLGLSYWKGLNKYLDFSVRLNGISSTKNQDLTDNSNFAVELEPSLNVRPMGDNHLFSPFLTAGIGGGYYPTKLGAYVPLGLGLQTNFNSQVYILLQAEYKKSLTQNIVGDNFFYSLGVAGNIGKAKAPKVAPLPIVPIVTDRDGDGVPDSLDKCPDVKGLASLNGCPDTDGDGIPDYLDKCPTVPGVAKYNGCPVPDTDGDGIDDEHDKCPTVKGLARYQGCPIPDTDGDGVNDEEDKCPTVPGPASNHGCPEIKKEVVAKVNMAAKDILFASGSSKLLAKSTVSLNDVATILKENSSYKLNVDGYTDNTGNAEKNQTLSDARVNTVKDYLVNKGIDASRLTVAGHGQNNPIADNKTAAGRAQNRRVELKLSNN